MAAAATKLAVRDDDAVAYCVCLLCVFVKVAICRQQLQTIAHLMWNKRPLERTTLGRSQVE